MEVKNEIRKFHKGVKIVNNNEYRDGSILSLGKALSGMDADIIIVDGDTYFERGIIEKMALSKKRNYFLIDSSKKGDPEAVIVGFTKTRAVDLARGLSGKYYLSGEWAGFLRLSKRSARKLKDIIDRKIFSGEKHIGYEFVVPELFNYVPITYELVDGLKWTEIDFFRDIKYAESLKIANGG